MRLEVILKCGPPLIQGMGKPFPLGRANEWVPVMRWLGFTLKPIRIKVVLPAGRRETVHWRRWGTGVPVGGTMGDEEEFTIYPGEFAVSIDLKSENGDIPVTILGR